MTNWSKLFRVAALFNWLVGIPLLVAPLPMLTMLGLPVPPELTFHRLAALLIAIFGMLYWMIANAPERYRPLAGLGVAGKLAVFALFAQAWLAGNVPLAALGIAVGDLIFGIFFALFLRATAKLPA